ncbi:hypothetical protein E2C01_084715 [Portunus trituberculatus]|uniref:Uncharacterized protein n=1 Tax=Portunus trituberculatus TaxID=210409 RepID=A0A5B7J6Z1_PORTR|nr:hypothetical protein [Portunus trituberculatus]
MKSYGPMFRIAHDLIKAKSQWSKKQTKIETFFKPTTHLLTPHPDQHRRCQVPCHLTMYHCPAYLHHHALQIHPNPSSTYASYHQQDIDVELKSASEEADK